MPDSPLREAFELISHYLLYNEEFGVRLTAMRRAMGEGAETGHDCATGGAARTGPAGEPVFAPTAKRPRHGNACGTGAQEVSGA